MLTHFFYVGKTDDLDGRCKTHVQSIFNKTHGTVAFRDAVAKYGIQNFIYVKIRANMPNLPPLWERSDWLQNFVLEATKRNLDWDDSETRTKEETAWIQYHSSKYMSCDGVDCSVLYNAHASTNEDTKNKQWERKVARKAYEETNSAATRKNIGEDLYKYLNLCYPLPTPSTKTSTKPSTKTSNKTRTKSDALKERSASVPDSTQKSNGKSKPRSKSDPLHPDSNSIGQDSTIPIKSVVPKGKGWNNSIKVDKD